LLNLTVCRDHKANDGPPVDNEGSFLSSFPTISADFGCRRLKLKTSIDTQQGTGRERPIKVGKSKGDFGEVRTCKPSQAR